MNHVVLFSLWFRCRVRQARNGELSYMNERRKGDRPVEIKAYVRRSGIKAVVNAL